MINLNNKLLQIVIFSYIIGSLIYIVALTFQSFLFLGTADAIFMSLIFTMFIGVVGFGYIVMYNIVKYIITKWKKA